MLTAVPSTHHRQSGVADDIDFEIKGQELQFVEIELDPGESVTLLPGVWHAFWGEGGDVLIGEVSTVNDDLTDNIFRDPIGRFSDIEEDTAPLHLLVSDYDRWIG